MEDKSDATTSVDGKGLESLAARVVDLDPDFFVSAQSSISTYVSPLNLFFFYSNPLSSGLGVLFQISKINNGPARPLALALGLEIFQVGETQWERPERRETPPAGSLVRLPTHLAPWSVSPGRASAAPPTTHRRPVTTCLLYTSPSPRDGLLSRMPSSA